VLGADGALRRAYGILKGGPCVRLFHIFLGLLGAIVVKSRQQNKADHEGTAMQIKTLLLMGLAGGLAVAALSGCQKRVKAPDVAGACYYVGYPKTGGLKFNELSKNEPDLEHCAVRLYNARMDMMATQTAGQQTIGAYNGTFLFAGGREVRYSRHYEGPAFPLLVKAPDGRLVAPGSVVQEEAPSGGQVTVDIPKDLPQMPSDTKK
jgi:hypothetical protein